MSRSGLKKNIMKEAKTLPFAKLNFVDDVFFGCSIKYILSPPIFINITNIEYHFTAVCIVLTAESEIQANLRFNILFIFAISGLHKGCTLGTLLATPPKVGVFYTVLH